MATSINACEADVQSAFDKAHAIARSEPPASRNQVETTLWTAMLALGRALIALYLARAAARPRATEYAHDGAKYVLVGFASSEIGTRFGKVLFERAVGRRVRSRRTTARSTARSDSTVASVCRR